MTPEDIEFMDFARTAVERDEVRPIREGTGHTRPEFTALAGGAFSVAALRAWEAGLRRPRGRQGIAYGRLLASAVHQALNGGERF